MQLGPRSAGCQRLRSTGSKTCCEFWRMLPSKRGMEYDAGNERDFMYRHGDVIILPVSSIPADATRRPSAVLARGEATGHSHRIADVTDVEVFDYDGVGFLRVGRESATLIHDEHHPI